jgi:MerR family transcriptional regulator, heat shock protein HspR
MHWLCRKNLRLYERHGLLTPSRSDGGTRRYSADDLARLQRISELVAAGVNLAGIARILDLQDDNATLLAANQAIGPKARREPNPDPTTAELSPGSISSRRHALTTNLL